jgi:hypothetical protein
VVAEASLRLGTRSKFYIAKGIHGPALLGSLLVRAPRRNELGLSSWSRQIRVGIARRKWISTKNKWISTKNKLDPKVDGAGVRLGRNSGDAGFFRCGLSVSYLWLW